VDAAFRVLEREGAGGLSMRRVAQELGVSAGSLYWHVASEDALIDLLIDRTASEVTLPPPDPDRWQEQLREWVMEVRRVFQRRPGVAALTLGRVPTGPNLVRWTEWGLVLLRGAGIPDRVATYAGDPLGLYLGATAYEATLPPMQSATGEPLTLEEVVGQLRDYFASMPADQFPNVVATVDVILRGLASYARP
jgi:AcrR family transcriptional regulator